MNNIEILQKMYDDLNDRHIKNVKAAEEIYRIVEKIEDLILTDIDADVLVPNLIGKCVEISRNTDVVLPIDVSLGVGLITKSVSLDDVTPTLQNIKDSLTNSVNQHADRLSALKYAIKQIKQI